MPKVANPSCGANIISGGDGNDTLTGLGGADKFLFGTSLNDTTNVDQITDFNVTDDTIWLSQSIFNALSAGQISASEFTIGAAATTASQRIIYNSTNGAVSYDADGVGGAAAIRFATLATGLSLTEADFVVV